MEPFRTGLSITPNPMIDHGSRIVTAGSCFSDNIGQKLSENKFTTLVNPLGVCYNPLSIHKGLMMSAAEEDLYVESQGKWRHFDFHSKFSGSAKEEVRGILKNALTPWPSDIIVLTYGTSWVYRHKSTGKIVANCHKRPQQEFEKILLSVDDIVASFSMFRKTFGQRIILTLSPVRHIKDTLELNSVSKAILRQTIYGIVNKFSDVDYFPAYEIMMDDLRDYRFYDADMIHPSPVAIDYIWEKFGERYFSVETRELNARWGKIVRSLNHRVFNPSSQQHQEFLRHVLTELHELKKAIDVSKEIADIEHRLNA